MRGIKIISGGQSGVDRAALDAAIACGVPCGGWCPRSGWAEDFPNPPGLLAKYPMLKETPIPDPAQRTEWNVRDSDATIILLDAAGLVVSRGSGLAQQLAGRHGKPLIVIDLGSPDAAERAAGWLQRQLEVWRERQWARDTQSRDEAYFALGVGGPRESEAPGIYASASAFMRGLLQPL